MPKPKKRFEKFLVPEDVPGDESTGTFSFQAYVSHMRKPAEWGGEPELRILEEVYDRPIFVYSCDVAGGGDDRDFTLPLLHYNDSAEEALCAKIAPLRLSFHGNNHYNAVVLTTASATDFMAVPEKNRAIIRSFRKDTTPANPDAFVRWISFLA
jgi:hypothetical protein